MASRFKNITTDGESEIVHSPWSMVFWSIVDEHPIQSIGVDYRNKRHIFKIEEPNY